MEATADGRISVTHEEAALLRAALFVALHHHDEVLSEDFRVIAGFEEEDFRVAMRELDRLRGL